MCSRRLTTSFARGKKSGLSIVELIVVIAILSVLAGILIPVIFSSRQMAYRTQCTSNLKQLGAAFALYANDWQAYWPCPGGLPGNRSYWAQSGDGGLNRYVKQQGLGSIWCCPLLDEWVGKYPPRSYSMNSFLRTPHDVYYPSCIGIQCGICTTELVEASKTILLFEGVPICGRFQNTVYSEDQIAVAYTYRCANWSWVRGYTDNILHTIEPGNPWHGKVNNYLYCDGHVLSRKPYKRDMNSRFKVSMEEMYEWYVDKSRVAEDFAKMHNIRYKDN